MSKAIWTQAMEQEFHELKKSIFHSNKPLNVFSDEVESSPEMARYEELIKYRQAYLKLKEKNKSKTNKLFNNIDLN